MVDRVKADRMTLSPLRGERAKSLRILYHHRIRSKDGQAVHLEELISALRELGHDVLLVGPKAFAHASFGHDPKALAVLKTLIPRAAYEMLELGYNLAAYMRLRAACGRFHPDVIYERHNLYLLAGIWCGKALQLPVLLEVNAPLAEERANFGGLGLPWLAKALERHVWRKADVVLPVTRVLAEKLNAAGVSRERITVIANAIDPAKFAAVPPTQEAKDQLRLSNKLVLGFTGFVREWHGLEAVLTLLARPSAPANLHFLLIGEGPAISGLRTQAGQLGISDRVTFAGLVERDKIGSHLAAFDIAVLPKCVDYCSPLKLFEYLVAGKAIVAPDQPNIREIVSGEEHCLLFEPENYEAMTDAILRLAADEALRNRYGDAVRSLVSRRGYTWMNNAARVSALAATAVAAKGSSRDA
jgi:glycosyltransferase involved in cell wall biosynthesis